MRLPGYPCRFETSADALHGPVDRSRRPFRVVVPDPGSSVTLHLTADRSPSRPRFRGLIPLPVGAAPLDFSSGTPSWLSWDSSSLGRSPSIASASTVAAFARLSVRGWVQRLRRCRLPPPGHPGFGTPHDVWPPLRHFRKNPRSGFPSLYSRVSKNLGNRLSSSEVACPFEVFLLVPAGNSSFLKEPTGVGATDRPQIGRAHV